jgi:hypothetical protein
MLLLLETGHVPQLLQCLKNYEILYAASLICSIMLRQHTFPSSVAATFVNLPQSTTLIPLSFLDRLAWATKLVPHLSPTILSVCDFDQLELAEIFIIRLSKSSGHSIETIILGLDLDLCKFRLVFLHQFSS